MNFAEMSQADIMMMPDHVFGRRWWVTVTVTSASAVRFGVCDAALPERIVIWGVGVWSASVAVGETVVRFKVGDALPAVLVEFQALEGPVDEFEYVGIGRGVVEIAKHTPLAFWPMRKPFASSGRRLVVGCSVSGAVEFQVGAGLLISSSPSGEVPAWLL